MTQWEALTQEQGMTERQIDRLYWRATLVVGVLAWVGIVAAIAALAWGGK